MAAPLRPDDLMAKLGELEAAIARLERSDKVSNSTVKKATIWFTDGSVTHITAGLQSDGDYGFLSDFLQTLGGQRFKIFVQASDPGAADTDPTVTRIWLQAT